MPRIRGLALLVISSLLPAPAAAQAWLDATRDYERAAVLLHEIVTDPDFALSGRDPLPARHLALLYANGLGVPRDGIAACALAQDAQMATQLAPPEQPVLTREDADRYQAGLQGARDFAAAHCDALSPADSLTAARSRGGCYAFGMLEQVVIVGGRSVRVGRAGVALDGTPDGDRHDLTCAAAIGRMRPISIEPPENAAPGVAARHFIELVFWRVGTDQRTRKRAYVATWQMYEVRRNAVGLIVEEMFEEVAHWPGAV